MRIESSIHHSPFVSIVNFHFVRHDHSTDDADDLHDMSDDRHPSNLSVSEPTTDPADGCSNSPEYE